MDLITSRGYPVNNYTVETEDGYILKIHRIPPPNGTTVHYPVVFLHGLFATSEVWVVRGRNKDLAFLLQDAGYDVWLPNTRGNYYSRKHRSLKNTQKKYWEFGWNEMAIYDAPLIIDKVLEVTNQSKVILIGHSMGTTIFFAMMAKKPEYSKKIAVHISLAPTVIMKNMQAANNIRFAVDNASMMVKIFHQLGQYDPMRRDIRLIRFLQNFCRRNGQYQFCLEILFFVGGIDAHQVDKTDLVERYLCYYPAGTSARCLIHYAQNIRSGRFLEYNYGKKGNLIKYGTEYPPEYNISGIDIPINLYFSGNDYLVSKKDVMTLTTMLPKSNLKIYQIPYKYFNHFDFVIAMDAKKYLYDKVIEDLAIY